MSEFNSQTETESKPKARLPPRRGQIKAGMMSNLAKTVTTIASGVVGKVVSANKVATEENTQNGDLPQQESSKHS